MPSSLHSRRRFLGSSAAALALPLLAPARGLAFGSTRGCVADADALDGDDLATIGRTPHSKFAINVEIWWGKLPFLERLDQVKRLGFQGIEFWPWRGKDLDALKKRKDELGLQITQFTAWGFEPGMNDPKNHERALKEIEESCKVATFLGAPMMTVVAGNDQPGMTQEQMHENVIACLKKAAPIAEKHGTILILEPMNIRVDHKGHCLYGSPAALRICREVASPFVKINWDLYHMHISEGDLCGRMKDGFDQIAYFQVADHPGRNEPGTGEIQYSRVLRQAWELGYRGWFGTECWPSRDEASAARAFAAADAFATGAAR